MKSDNHYKKYTYWLTREEELSLRESLAATGIKLKSAKGVTCTPLDELTKIASVAPEVWDDHCSRAGAWYKRSAKNGLFLIVSSFELLNLANHSNTVISAGAFTPPRTITPEEEKKLIQTPEFMAKMPATWEKATENEKKIYLRWAHKLGSKIENFDALGRIHSANHANFIQPRFYIERNSLVIPYSLDRSAHLCSCCLELYNILGQDFRKKLVRPCPGAVFYARLEPDRYFLVESND
ncbi:MAG: hypothetical protein EHM45_04265 [Desulfobacteraceae bacterium]|nr:MAG: hypothetical protein EHM45_04265 [Desulfobacteraceae bacterium]